jgi:ABC-type proline/glycine betaine transport system substrate-binding protein
MCRVFALTLFLTAMGCATGKGAAAQDAQRNATLAQDQWQQVTLDLQLLNQVLQQAQVADMLSSTLLLLPPAP